LGDTCNPVMAETLHLHRYQHTQCTKGNITTHELFRENLVSIISKRPNDNNTKPSVIICSENTRQQSIGNLESTPLHFLRTSFHVLPFFSFLRGPISTKDTEDCVRAIRDGWLV
jgi:hypothetical protein